MVKGYIWNTTLYGAENWTLWEVDKKYLECFERWCWRRLEKSTWTDRVRRKKYYKETRREEYPTNSKNEGRYMDWSHLAQERPF